MQIDPLDPNQTMATPEEVSPNDITAARALSAGLSVQETSQIDFYAERPSEVQVIEIIQRARTVTDLVTRKKPPNYNNPPAQLMLAFDQVLADLEMKLLQQYRFLQGTLIQIVKRVWLATLKFNFCAFISIYDTIYKVNMTQALIGKTEQGNILKTEPSAVIRPKFNNQLFRSLRALPQTEGAHLASIDTQLTRNVGFKGALDQELKKLIAQQVIDLIKGIPKIMPPEWIQDLARKPMPETKLTAFLPFLSHLKQQSLNSYAPLNPFCNQLHQQQIQGQQSLRFPFQYSGQPMQYPIQPIQFPVLPALNPFSPTMNPPQTQIREPQLPSNENIRDQQNSIQSSQQVEQAAIQTIERPQQKETVTRNTYILLDPKYLRICYNKLLEYHCYPTLQREINNLDRVKDQYLQHVREPMRYDLVRDPSVIKYKNSKWHSKLTTQKPFTFSDWREFWSDAVSSLEQIKIPHYLSKEYKSQSPDDKSRRHESVRIYEREKEYAIENGKRMKKMRLEKLLLEAEGRKKQNSSSNSSSSSIQQILEDWTGKGNTITL
ncbi:MAG: hypothetical protein EZS28_010410 [Streblomastix strix]|uniref:Uncharacterized protein n=1 Tax=Streblomastix strix TaxID=222440 RepID=A0A5J4WGC7_9EUKA|nr:MAG: hypothetical protein EZS28_010410 [Streblomastix strix]